MNLLLAIPALLLLSGCGFLLGPFLKKTVFVKTKGKRKRETLYARVQRAKKENRGLNRLGQAAGRLSALFFEAGVRQPPSFFLIPGGILAMLLGFVCLKLDNPFLLFSFVPLGFALGFAPPLLTVLRARKRMEIELEPTLRLLTASVLRTHDIRVSVRENLPYLRQPLRAPFVRFLQDCDALGMPTSQALEGLRDRVPDPVFGEWCETLRLSLSDRTHERSLQSVADLLTDRSRIASEVAPVLGGARAEYVSMVAMVVLNLPLLAFLNPEWYDVLVGTPAGKAVLGLSALTILVTGVLCFRLTRMPGYRSRGRGDGKGETE